MDIILTVSGPILQVLIVIAIVSFLTPFAIWQVVQVREILMKKPFPDKMLRLGKIFLISFIVTALALLGMAITALII